MSYDGPKHLGKITGNRVKKGCTGRTVLEPCFNLRSRHWNEETERPSDMPRAHRKAKVPNEYVHGPSLMGVDTVNRKRQKCWCEGRLCHHLLGRTAKPQPVPGDWRQGTGPADWTNRGA